MNAQLPLTPMGYQFQKGAKSCVAIARLPLGRFGAGSSINKDGQMWITGGKIANMDGEVIQVVDAK